MRLCWKGADLLEKVGRRSVQQIDESDRRSMHALFGDVWGRGWSGRGSMFNDEA